MAVFYVARPLDFGVFPTVLLLATLLRLALNVASTRVVLLHGHTGTGAAGHVIEAFGEFVVGGNYAVGVVVFVILTIINFVVVTKGAGRISEVSARFTLDAMPGKQMAIDADLNAGLITQDEARARRAEVRAEADFYGSMDGASKFVRGDAVAGILILFINIIGGLAIGTLGHGLAFADAARTYTLLTIGDGLVAQIPALLLSTAVAIIVTRMSRPQDMGGELRNQLFGNRARWRGRRPARRAWASIPGMPNVAFLLHRRAVRRRRLAMLQARARLPPPKPAPAAAGAAARRDHGAVLGRRAAGRPARTRSRLPPGAAGGHEPGRRPARRASAACAASSRRISASWCRRCTSATTSSSRPTPIASRSAACRSAKASIYPGPRARHQSRARVRPACRASRRAIRPSAWRRSGSSPARASTPRPSVTPWWMPSTVIATHLSAAHPGARARAARPRGSAAAAQRPGRQDGTEAGRGPGAQGAAARRGGAGAAGPARRAGADPQHARHPRDPRRARTALDQDPAVLQAQVRIALGRQIVQDIAGPVSEVPVMTLDADLERLLQGALTSSAANPRPRARVWQRGCRQRLAESAHRRKWPESRPCCWCRRRCGRRSQRFVRVECAGTARARLERDSATTARCAW